MVIPVDSFDTFKVSFSFDLTCNVVFISVHLVMIVVKLRKSTLISFLSDDDMYIMNCSSSSRNDERIVLTCVNGVCFVS
jgi:hypothetical protein